ncbi:hypothetical protein BVG19_g3787 [[Candida] boidinii]|nr:hypothetical protein BVG19_g3787 [[Candida] boidinii]OWB50506.1 hypothetical protein B5S27_g2056 [[Candida] boidinii]OWB66018.1 hypothetical protein B5S30_g1352 [[Candida] boidinii]GMF99023.1 unnamed protein product [[Candida] boidinii]
MPLIDIFRNSIRNYSTNSGKYFVSSLFNTNTVLKSYYCQNQITSDKTDKFKFGFTKKMSTVQAYPNISSKLREIISSHLPKSSPEKDFSTNSNYYNFDVKNSTLDVLVSFDKKILTGYVSYDIEVLEDTDNIILDTSYLNIKTVSVDDSQVEFEILPRKEPLGSPLLIKASSKKGDSIVLKIDYETTENCTALQWLDPPQTDGGKLPYLFSQCEPIHARSFFPSFDTPSIKSPYTFNVKSPLNTLLSGRRVNEEKKGDVTLFQFHQPVPIPSYLVAIASGDLVGASIGPRSTVYSEPCAIDSCQYEFKEDTENFIATAESLIFEYEWKNYDVLILNRAMPFGGMEHPNITFATPTLISGDRQNVDVIAHELAHSWSGNLVTNCSWDHFWLNEGWTVYIERRIIGKLHGEKHRQFSAIIGWTDLENSIKSMGDSAKIYSTLIQDLKDGSDPDDSFSTVPYEKGFCLLYTIEQTLGQEKFNKFLPYYFSLFKYKSLDSYQFLDTLYGFFKDDAETLDSIDWKTWLYEPYLPPKPDFDTTLVDECYSLASKWVKTATESPESLESTFSPSDIDEFGSNQNGVFLDTLVAYEGKDGFSWSSENGQKALSVMKSNYSAYSTSQNAEVLFRWYRLELTGKITSSYQKLADWLGTVGRMKFVRPSYVLLNQVDRELALKTFHKYEMGYHPICRAMVKKDLSL